MSCRRNQTVGHDYVVVLSCLVKTHQDKCLIMCLTTLVSTHRCWTICIHKEPAMKSGPGRYCWVDLITDEAYSNINRNPIDGIKQPGRYEKYSLAIILVICTTGVSSKIRRCFCSLYLGVGIPCTMNIALVSTLRSRTISKHQRPAMKSGTGRYDCVYLRADTSYYNLNVNPIDGI